MKKVKILSIFAATVLLSTHAQADNVSNIEYLNTKPPSAKLPFSEAVKVGNTVYLSGQIGFDPKTKSLVKGGFKAETKQTLTNIKSSLNKYGYSMKDVVKCLVMLTDINDFKEFNEIYTSYFTPPYPARSAFAVSSLALNSKVEVECIAAVK